MKKNGVFFVKSISMGLIFVVAALGVFAAQVKKVDAATPSGVCPTGSDITFTNTSGSASYQAGDSVQVSASSSGSWSLCVYRASDGSRLGQTANNTVPKSLTFTATDNDIAVIQAGSACILTFPGGDSCQLATAVSAGGSTGGGSSIGGVANIDIQNPIAANDFLTLVQNVLRWILGIAGSIALLMLIYGGVTYIASTGNQQEADKAKRIITWTVLGLILILLSYSIITVIDSIFAS